MADKYIDILEIKLKILLRIDIITIVVVVVVVVVPAVVAATAAAAVVAIVVVVFQTFLYFANGCLNDSHLFLSDVLERLMLISSRYLNGVIIFI